MKIEYQTHVQSIGWQGWKRDGQIAGTTGQKKRLEAIQIRLDWVRWQISMMFIIVPMYRVLLIWLEVKRRRSRTVGI